MRIHHAGERNHTHFGRAAADIHHHRAGRFFNRQTRANCSGHRFFNQINVCRACFFGRITNGFALHLCRTARHTNHNARRRRPLAVVHFMNEFFQHFARHVKVGNHAVFQRADGLDAARRAAEHSFGFGSDRQRVVFAVLVCLHRHHRWLVQHDTFAFHINQRICRSQINGNIVGKITSQKTKHKSS